TQDTYLPNRPHNLPHTHRVAMQGQSPVLLNTVPVLIAHLPHLPDLCYTLPVSHTQTHTHTLGEYNVEEKAWACLIILIKRCGEEKRRRGRRRGGGMGGRERVTKERKAKWGFPLSPD